jgi:LytS/YehU family sensor histidine kinase
MSVQVSEQALATLIPPLILQPLVENAVLHGIAHLLEGGTVSISGELEKSTLRIRVSNPSDPDRPRNRRPGFGLMLVRERLQSQYAGAAQLEVREAEGNYIAEVSVPFE